MVQVAETRRGSRRRAAAIGLAGCGCGCEFGSFVAAGRSEVAEGKGLHQQRKRRTKNETKG